MMPMTGLAALPLSRFELPWYDFDVSLDGTRYNFTMRYNTRMDRWFLDIADAQKTPMVSGIELLTGRLLTEPYKTLPIPQGYFFVIDNTGNNAQPTMQSFLTTHTLYYGSVD